MGIIYGIEDLTDRHEKYDVIKNDIVDSADVCIIGIGGFRRGSCRRSLLSQVEV